MTVAPAAGLARSPTTGTPAREPRSARRTSHMDMIPLGETTAAGLRLEGAARDLLTSEAGAAVVLDEVRVRADLGEARKLEKIETEPVTDRLAGLIGCTVATGFRALAGDLLPRERDGHTPLYLLLDELPVAGLIAGYLDLYQRSAGEAADDSRRRTSMVKSDICAGWASDGTMMRALQCEGRIPVPIGPAAPPLESDDPSAWHDLPPLPIGAMRRRRRIDVVHDRAAGTIRIDAFFRDTHKDPDGNETVLHEWVAKATVSPDRLTVLTCSAVPRVLPWTECPAAAGSAHRLAGQRLDDLRTFVRQNLTGTSTCTHLNDLLRSLADGAPLWRQLDAAGRI